MQAIARRSKPPMNSRGLSFEEGQLRRFAEIENVTVAVVFENSVSLPFDPLPGSVRTVNREIVCTLR
jgi:hypothetical protein